MLLMTEYTFHIKGSVSINKIYSAPHWTTRSKLKAEWRLLFEDMFDAYDTPKIYTYGITCYFNNRLDLDNNAMMVKFFNDALRSSGWIVDDNPKFFTSLKMLVDKELEKNSAKFVLSVL